MSFFPFGRALWLTAQEYSDVQLTDYLTTLTKQLDALNDVSFRCHCRQRGLMKQYADKHTALYMDGGGNDQGNAGFRRSGKSGMGFSTMRNR